MFGLFKSDPIKSAQKEYEVKLTEAMNAQRSGNIELYASLSAEAEELLNEIERLKNNKKT